MLEEKLRFFRQCNCPFEASLFKVKSIPIIVFLPSNLNAGINFLLKVMPSHLAFEVFLIFTFPFYT